MSHSAFEREISMRCSLPVPKMFLAAASSDIVCPTTTTESQRLIPSSNSDRFGMARASFYRMDLSPILTPFSRLRQVEYWTRSAGRPTIIAPGGPMRRHRTLLLVSFALTLVLTAPLTLPGAIAAAQVPSSLTDQEFWRLSQSISEPDGAFRSDNLLSNEMVFARLLPEFLPQVKPGGVYLGVGPEQNFTYIVAMKAKVAFITDIRRENLHLMLMYKALFELSKDRAEFISLLFTKARPSQLTAASTIREIMGAYWDTPSGDEAAYAANLQAIQRHLTKTRALPLPQSDVDGVAQVYRAFYYYGPAMNYSASLSLTNIGAGNAATYRDLMTQADANGQFLTFLGSEESFKYLKDLEANNLIVPVVGNFSGPKAIRGIGEYLSARGV